MQGHIASPNELNWKQEDFQLNRNQTWKLGGLGRLEQTRLDRRSSLKIQYIEAGPTLETAVIFLETTHVTCRVYAQNIRLAAIHYDRTLLKYGSEGLIVLCSIVEEQFRTTRIE